ncbi:MAG: type II toxin-antitoxin system HigB family toxin [Gallionellaceae bacterium]
MHIISRKLLVDFWHKHSSAKKPMEAWHKVVERASWGTFTDIRNTFNSADKAGELVVFDVGAGYRIIAAVHFNRNKVFLQHVFTHAEYDDWNEQQRKRSRK